MPYQANRRVHGMPPSLLVTNTREALLSSTAVFWEALLGPALSVRAAVGYNLALATAGDEEHALILG